MAIPKFRPSVARTFTTLSDRAMQSVARDPLTGCWSVSQADGYPPEEHTRITLQSATADNTGRHAALGMMRLLYAGHGTVHSLWTIADQLGVITYWEPGPKVAGGLVWVPFKPGDVPFRDSAARRVFPGYTWAHIAADAGTVALRKGNLVRVFELHRGIDGLPVAGKRVGVDVRLVSKKGQPGQGYFHTPGQVWAPYGYGKLTDPSTVDIWSMDTGQLVRTMTGRPLPDLLYPFQEPEGGIYVDGAPHVGLSARLGVRGRKTPTLVRMDPRAEEPTVTRWVRPIGDPAWGLGNAHPRLLTKRALSRRKLERLPGYKLTGTLVVRDGVEYLRTRFGNFYAAKYLTDKAPK